MSAVAEEVGTESTEAKPKKKTEVEVVTMTDGRKVEFAGKKRMLKDYVLKEDGSLDFARFDYRNGETRTYRIPEAMIGRFAGHGVLQKYGDEIAGMKASADLPAGLGNEPDLDDVILEIDSLDERIQKLEWTVEREGGGLGGSSILIKALMEYSSQTIEQVKEFLKAFKPKDRQQLRTNDVRKNKAGVTLKSIVDRLEAEKAAKVPKIDTSEALSQLDALGG